MTKAYGMKNMDPYAGNACGFKEYRLYVIVE
jgi:hypothetical protein